MNLPVRVTLVSLMLIGCGRAIPSIPETRLAAAYSCEESCVPVSFQVYAPDFMAPFDQVYLWGSFNNWTEADSSLLLEPVDEHVYRREIMLPAGDTLEYGYVLGYTNNRPVIQEESSPRSVAAHANLVVEDTVLAWSSNAGESDSLSLVDIARLQRRYIAMRFAGFGDKPETAGELDKLVDRARLAWREEARRYFNGFEELTSEAYLHLLASQRSPERSFNKTVGCRLLSEYQLPAFRTELQYSAQVLDAERARLLTAGLMVAQIPYCDGMTDESWMAATETYRSLRSVLDAYLELPDLTAVTNGALVRLRDSLEDVHLDFEFGTSVRRGDLERARRLMLLAIADPARHRSYSAYLASQLSRAYSTSDRSVDAMGVLDVAAQHISNMDLPSDTLQAWYRAVAGKRGVAHFQQLNASLSRDELRGTGEPLKLEGTYLDVTSGTDFNLSTLKGKQVIIDFWTTYCGPCMQEIPDLIEFQKRIADRQDIAFVSVSEDGVDPSGISIEEVAEVIRTRGINYVVLYDRPDNPISRHFNIVGYPTKYVLDQGGRIVSSVSDLSPLLAD